MLFLKILLTLKRNSMFTNLLLLSDFLVDSRAVHNTMACTGMILLLHYGPAWFIDWSGNIEDKVSTVNVTASLLARELNAVKRNTKSFLFVFSSCAYFQNIFWASFLTQARKMAWKRERKTLCSKIPKKQQIDGLQNKNINWQQQWHHQWCTRNVRQ